MEQRISIEFSNQDLKRLIVPLVIEQFLAITVGLADSLMVSQVGEAAVSAVSLVDSVNVLLQNVFASLATGGAVVAGQYLGRREMEKANHSAQQLLLFMGESSLLITVLLYLLKPFILHRVFGSIAPDVAGYANTYFLIVEASTVFLAIYSAGAALFRVMGNSGISMKVSLIMNAVNVAGNAILIFGFRMGVAGVAIPTLISKIVAAILMAALLHNPALTLHLDRHFSFHHERVMIRNILRFGVPNGIEGGMFQLGKILLLSVVATFGTPSVAANAVSNVICSFECLAAQSTGLGMVTVISRCIGAGQVDRARAYTRKLMRWGYLAMAGSIVLIVLLLPLILRAYNLSAEATGYARMIVWSHSAAGLFFWPMSFEFPQVLRAAGDTRFTMIVSSVSMWTFRVIFGIVFATTLGLGVWGTWLAMYVDWVARSICFLIRYHGHRWEYQGLKE